MDKNVKNKLNRFFRGYTLKKFAKGEKIIRADTPPKGVLYLKSGVVIQLSVTTRGEEIIINTFKSPSFFPMAWVLNDRIPIHDYQASGMVEVFIAPRHIFLEFLTKNPEVMVDLLKRIFIGLEGYIQKVESIMGGRAYNRLLVGLLINAKRFGSRKKDSSAIILKVTQQKLAAEVGLTRETVSRELSVLKSKKIIELTNNKIVILDLNKLEEESLQSY